MKDYILEVCVDSVESALAAERGGATRLELCANLVIGGTTPGYPLFEQVKKETGLPVRTLIRPRFGDFLYTQYEHRQMLQDIRHFAPGRGRRSCDREPECRWNTEYGADAGDDGSSRQLCSYHAPCF